MSDPLQEARRLKESLEALAGELSLGMKPAPAESERYVNDLLAAAVLAQRVEDAKRENERLRKLLGETDYIFAEGDARCGAVHDLAKAVCMLPKGHEGEHRNTQGYWMPRENEFYVARQALRQERPA